MASKSYGENTLRAGCLDEFYVPAVGSPHPCPHYAATSGGFVAHVYKKSDCCFGRCSYTRIFVLPLYNIHIFREANSY
jgi:hypothetical protein